MKTPIEILKQWQELGLIPHSEESQERIDALREALADDDMIELLTLGIREEIFRSMMGEVDIDTIEDAISRVLKKWGNK